MPTDTPEQAPAPTWKTTEVTPQPPISRVYAEFRGSAYVVRMGLAEGAPSWAPAWSFLAIADGKQKFASIEEGQQWVRVNLPPLLRAAATELESQS